MSKVPELQKAGAECMKKFIAGHAVDMELVHTTVRPLLLKLGDHRTLNLNVIQRIHSLTQLFPNAFNEKLCEQMLVSQVDHNFLLPDGRFDVDKLNKNKVRPVHTV